MRLALFADVHANLEALDACLEHASGQTIDQFAYLGDMVGYGPDPAGVLDRIQAQCANGGVALLGNHDEAAIGSGEFDLNDNARLAIEWTREQLQPAHRSFLASLPLLLRIDECALVHASAAVPQRWTYVTDARQAERSMEAAAATWVLGGHVHEPALYFHGADARLHRFQPVPGVPIPVPRHRRWLGVVGSCGQPRDGKPLANYAVLDTERAELTYHRIAYDNYLTASKIRQSGLPEDLAYRIELGR